MKPAATGKEEAAALATRAAPILRGILAWPTGDEDRPHRRSVLEWRCSAEILDIVNSTEAAALASTGPLTGDHVIHTKPKPLLVEKPSWSKEELLPRQLRDAVEVYRRDYRDYVAAHGGPTDGVDPSPRVVLLPGAGLFCWAGTKQQARITADIAEHTLFAKARATALGAYTSVSNEQVCDMEFRSLQRAKLGAAPDRPLEGQVVVISGGAGAIGSSVAVCCAEAGAHVVITDLDEDRVARVVRRIERQCPSGTALGLVMNVTDPASVREGFDRTVRAYGGVDVVVPNAGIAHVATIEEMDVAEFRRVMEVNAVGYLQFMQEAIR